MEDMVTEEKGDNIAEKMAAQNPAEVVELLQISEPRKQMPPFLVVTTQFGMTSWDDNMATNPDDVQGPDTDELPKRRLFAKMEETGGLLLIVVLLLTMMLLQLPLIQLRMALVISSNK